LYVNIELSNCDINDRKQKINDLYENKIISKKKNNLLFDFCKIIDINTFRGYIANEILQNKYNDHYVYSESDLKYYYKHNRLLLKLCNLLNISNDEIDIIIEHSYILFLNSIFNNFDYKHCNRYMYEIQRLIRQTIIHH
jgi:hypothetical protein